MVVIVEGVQPYESIFATCKATKYSHCASYIFTEQDGIWLHDRGQT